MPALRGNPWAVLSVLSLAFFMAQLDISVLTIAVPAITEEFGTSVDRVAWALGAYVLALAVTLITAGRLGDLYGRGRIFRIGVALFTVCSLLCALAQTPEQLIAARALQGVGAALITPQTMALLVEVFPAERRGTALGVRGAVGAAAAVAGPVVGGVLVSGLDWRWVFLVNLPIGVLLLASSLLFPADRRTGGSARLDLVGTALLTCSLLGLAVVLSQGERYDWQLGVWALLMASVVLFVVFLRQQAARQQRDPLVPFALFTHRNFTLMNGFAAAISLTVIGLVLVLSVFLQSVLEMSPLAAGLVIMPASLCSMLSSTFAGRLADRAQGRHVLLVGVALTVAGLLWTAAVMQQDVGWAQFVAPMCVIGVGNAFVFTPLVAVALQDVRPVLAGAAAGVLSTTLQLGSMIGTALVGAVLSGLGDVGAPGVGSSRTAMVLLAVVAGLAGLAALGAHTPPAAPVEEDPAKTTADGGEPSGSVEFSKGLPEGGGDGHSGTAAVGDARP